MTVKIREDYSIRLIEQRDNPQVAKLIVTVLESFGCIGPGYASSDTETNCMFESYQQTDARYWVVVEKATDRVVGGGGFSRLKETTVEESICEMQKLYFFEEIRGLGLGRVVVDFIVAEAAKLGYREMYLETIPAMKAAQALYQKTGFEYIDSHRGNTGHHERCKVYMLRPLQARVLTT